MKYIFYLGIFLMSNGSLFGQADPMIYFVNKFPLDSLNVAYVTIRGKEKLFSQKIHIELDYGQKNHILRDDDKDIVNQDGKKMEFNNIIHALNFMTQYGYEYIDSIVFSHADRVTHYYLLKKRR